MKAVAKEPPMDLYLLNSAGSLRQVVRKTATAEQTFSLRICDTQI